jgi:hypothetical protein
MLRWWDGEQWTDHRTDDPASPAAAREPAPYSGPSKTSGLAIASVVFGVFGIAVLAIVLGALAKDRIRRSGGRLTGDNLANTGIALGSIVVVVVAAILVVRDLQETSNAPKFTGDDKAIARVVDDLERAFAEDRGDQACDELLTVRFAAAVARGSGGTCAAFIDDAVDDGQYQADIRVKHLTVRGDAATAVVSEGGDRELWGLRRENGTWRVDVIRSR